MARYTQCLLDALRLHNPDALLCGWASWRRIVGWPIKPRNLPVRFFGARSPRNRPDLLHATACVFPEWKSACEVATVHDLYALQNRDGLDAEQIRRRTAYISRADRIICVSNFTRNHLHEILNDIPEHRTVAIPLAAASSFVPASKSQQQQFRDRHQLPAEFLLFIGRDRPNKNLDRLIEAYALSGLTIPLCIAGSQRRETRRRLSQIARANPCKGQVRWLGSFADPELPTLLSAASAVCMPSTFEGFGLPVIEAMACATPVLTSAKCATEEAAGGHAVLIDPWSVESIADGMVRVLQTSDAQRIAASAYARHRTWRDVAAETWREYELAFGKPLVTGAR